MRIQIYVLSFFIILGLLSCNNDALLDLPEGVHQVIVKETIDAAGYSYLRVNESNGDYWIAVPQLEVNINDTLYYSQSMTMMNFSSKSMDRSFDSILFVEDITYELRAKIDSVEHPTVDNKRSQKVKIEPLADGITVATAYANKESLNGKTVKIKGEVVKFNPAIMGRNWIHIQDGTADGSDFDLLVTSSDTVKLGQVIVITGVLAKDKDFGSGYKYTVIVENASIHKLNKDECCPE